MSIVIAIVNQPVCCVSTDSCQTKIFDFSDPSRNEYFNDVNKIHLFGKFLIAECGNPHAFAEYWRMAEQFRIGSGGIDRFIERSREILVTVGSRWRAHFRRKWPNLSPEDVRIYSRTIALIAGYSRRTESVVAQAVSDDPGMNTGIPDNGFIVSGGCSRTQEGTRDYLVKILSARVMMDTPEKMLQASIKGARQAARLEYRFTGQRSIGGRVRQMIISGDEPPMVVTSPVVNI